MTRRSARSPRFDATIVLTYYLPYTSGLTEVARTVAEGLAARGRRVAVVACRHEPGHPARETVNGVEVFRAPVVARIGRGVVSPAFAPARRAHRPRLPGRQPPSADAGAGIVARLAGDTPVVATHHDDVWLAGGALAPLRSRWSTPRSPGRCAARPPSSSTTWTTRSIHATGP